MYKTIEKFGLKALHSMDPEMAHGLSLKALHLGLAHLPGSITSQRLKTSVCGMALNNPIGLAAGFDKNAVAVNKLGQAGFGFLEVGAATPKPQEGNPKPRLFRLSEDRAVINRFGFNNEGMEAIGARLSKANCAIPVGVNLGANKASVDRAADFATVLRHCGPHVDFATVNVSSPNTEKLRDLQGRAALTSLLNGVMEARAELSLSIPVFLKIAPDLTDDELSEIVEVAEAADIDAIIATNTTLSREGLLDPQKKQAGGMSGAPLFEKSTRVVAKLSAQTALPLIGVGGVSSGQEAFTKIAAGASVVQLYSAMVYGGLSLVETIVNDLDDLMQRNGFANVDALRGSDRSNWL